MSAFAYATHRIAAEAQAKARTGFTAPVDIYSEMRRLDALATSLDGDIARNVIEGSFKTGWKDWFQRWKQFFTEKQTFFGPLAAAFHSDDLKAQVDGWWRDYEGWQASYSGQMTPGGQPVPPPTAPAPGHPPAPPPPEPPAPSPWYATFSLPWWAWMLGGVGVVGLAYSGWRVYKRTSETEERLRRATEDSVFGAMRAGGGWARDVAPPPAAVREIHYVPAGVQTPPSSVTSP